MSKLPAINKRELIAKHVAGRTFVDVGGLWGTKGEMVTAAAQAGAASVTMADIQEPGTKWWQRFRDRCRDFGVESWAELHCDICAPDAPVKMGTWDFVHCSGVMYHVPDLFGFVSNLIKITNQYLLLSSVTMPEQINNSAGRLTFSRDKTYLAPHLTDEHRAIVRGYLDQHKLTAAGITNENPFIEDGVARTGPWWWLFSGEFMLRLLELYNLEIVAHGPTRSHLGYTVLARVK